MNVIRNHPYMSRRTIKAWETNGGEFLQVIDARDIFHWNYSVEFELVPGGLDSIYSLSLIHIYNFCDFAFEMINI